MNTRNHTKEKPYLVNSGFFVVVFVFKIVQAKVNRVSKIHVCM